ncbi:MAG TPA: PadR family transcriptional regulator [Acidimicrobiales bacterium]|nr:PadR family transcriptional regulator [Acidimicrobiales bacterium]
MRDLSSTSFGILGLLAVRPWSAYELSKQVKRSLAYYWPRAERGIYDEPKKLVAHGLATATTEANGDRTRTVYTITRRGRAALRHWLREPSAPPRFESEAILRMTFAENGTKDDLLAAIRSVREHADVLRTRAEAIIRGYAEGRGPFPQRVHINALTGKFNISYVSMLERWAEWAEELVMTQWTDTRSPEGFPGAMALFGAMLDELTASATDPMSDRMDVRR